MTKNVLVITREIPPVGGGAGEVAISLSAEYIKKGYGVYIITMHYGGLPEFEQNDKLTIIRVRCGRKNQDSSQYWDMLIFGYKARQVIRRLAAEVKFEFIHAHAIIPDGFIAGYAKQKAKAPLVITAHGSDVPGYNPDSFKLAHRVMLPAWNFVLGKADLVVSPSNYLKSLILKQNPAADIAVIPNGIDIDSFQEKPGRPAFLIVSRLVRRKNYQLFLKAIEHIEQPLEVNIIGQGPMLDELKNIAKGQSRHNIFFHGWLGKGSAKWKQLYETSGYFVFPSSNENYPVSLLEAQLAGLLVLASPIPANKEVLEDYAIYFDDFEIESMQKTILNVIQMPQSKVDEITEKAKKRVIKNFSWDSISGKYLEMIEKIRT